MRRRAATRAQFYKLSVLVAGCYGSTLGQLARPYIGGATTAGGRGGCGRNRQSELVTQSGFESLRPLHTQIWTRALFRTALVCQKNLHTATTPLGQVSQSLGRAVP